MIKKFIDLYEKGKAKLPPIIFHSGLIFAFSMVGAVINFMTNLLIVPSYLSKHELGLVAPVTQAVAFGSLPLSVVTSLIIKYITKYEVNGEWGKLKKLIRDLIVFGLFSTVIVAVFFVATFDDFAVRVGVKSSLVLLWMLIYMCVSSWTPLLAVLTQATMRFFVIGIVGLLTPLTLMISAIFLLPFYGFTGYLISLILSTSLNVGIAVYSVWLYLKPHKERMSDYFSDCKDVLRKYLCLFVFSAGVNWLWVFLPPFVVKHFLDDSDAAGYFFVERLSQLPFYAFSALMTILLPVLSAKHENRQSLDFTVKCSFLYTAVLGSIVVVFLYFLSPVIFDIVPQWRDYVSYSKYIWVMSVYVVVRALNAILTTSLVSKWVFDHILYNVICGGLFCAILYLLFGWGGVRNYVPESLWNMVDVKFPKGIFLLLLLMISQSFSVLFINGWWYKRSIANR